jgi:anti-sigma B factor antagonist
VSPVPFETSISEFDGVHVVAVRGELDLSTAPDLEPQLEAALAAEGSLVIDLTECEFVDSTGIALIVRAWQKIEAAEKDGRAFAICSDGNQVGRVLEISGLNLSIPIHQSRDESLAALRDGSVGHSA